MTLMTVSVHSTFVVFAMDREQFTNVVAMIFQWGIVIVAEANQIFLEIALTIAKSIQIWMAYATMKTLVLVLLMTVVLAMVQVRSRGMIAMEIASVIAIRMVCVTHLKSWVARIRMRAIMKKM